MIRQQSSAMIRLMRGTVILLFLLLIGCATPSPLTGTAPTADSPAAASVPEPPTQQPFPLQAVAIFTAIGVFLSRELLEAFRRHNARERKKIAMKAFLARQCEFNNWGVKTLKRIISDIRDNLTQNSGESYELSFLKNGSIRLNSKHKDRVTSGYMLPVVRISEFESRLIDVAEIDSKFQTLLDNAASGSAEIIHVRDSLMSYILNEDGKSASQDDPFFESFTEYALEELDDSYDSLNELYRYCTGKPELAQTRLR